MDLKEETTVLRDEVQRLTNFVEGIEYDYFVNQYKIMETQDVIKFLLERLCILSWELENRG
jgi:predicted PilT family ATPase